jgi:hypothetical protein
MKVVFACILILAGYMVSAQNQFQRLAILQTSTSVRLTSDQKSASFASLCVDYDRYAKRDVDYNYVVAMTNIPVTITTRTNNKDEASQTTLANAINNGFVKVKSAGNGYRSVTIYFTRQDIRSVEIGPISGMAMISPYEADTALLSFGIILTNYPNLLKTPDLQKNIWKQAFLLDILRQNNKLSFNEGYVLSAESARLMEMLERDTLFRKFQFWQYKTIRNYISLDDNGQISGRSRTLLILRTKGYYQIFRLFEKIPAFWKINTIETGSKIRIQIKSSGRRIFMGNGGRIPPGTTDFNELYRELSMYDRESPDCKLEICLNVDPDDSTVTNVSLELECDGLTASLSLEIEYSSDDGLHLSIGSELAQAIGEDIELVVTDGKKTQGCEAKVSASFCIPSGIKTDLQVCNIRRSFKISGAKFNF